MGGVDVGAVTEITFGTTDADRRIHVRFTIVASQLPRVRADSTVRIASKGLLGDKALDLTMGNAGRRLADESEVRSEESDDIAAAMAAASSAMQRANEVLGNVATATRPLASPQLGNDITASCTTSAPSRTPWPRAPAPCTRSSRTRTPPRASSAPSPRWRPPRSAPRGHHRRGRRPRPRGPLGPRPRARARLRPRGRGDGPLLRPHRRRGGRHHPRRAHGQRRPAPDHLRHRLGAGGGQRQRRHGLAARHPRKRSSRAAAPWARSSPTRRSTRT